MSQENIEDLEKKDNQFANFEAPEKFLEKELGEKEKPLTPEKKLEGFEVKKEEGEAETVEKEEIETTVPTTVAAPAVKSPTFRNIENILEEDLSDVYFGMSPEKQKEFKEVGEETAGKIEKLISAVKFRTNKVFNLIKKWLKIIPGINKFFLEQEAKIKTDKILNLREKE